MTKFLTQGQVLIVCPQISLRSSLRKNLCDLGVNNTNITVAADFNQAAERLKGKPVNLLIADSEINENKNGIELFPLFVKNNPVSQNRVFVLIASCSTPFLMADFSLKGGDGIIHRPFTNDSFNKAIKSFVDEKEKMLPEDVLTYEIQDALDLKEMAKAQELVKHFKDPHCSQAYFCQGLIKEAGQEFEQAFNHFKQGLAQKISFKALYKIIQVGVSLKRYSELLQFVEVWLKNFPIHHGSLQDATRIIIANKKFELLDEIFQIFSQHKIEEQFAKSSLAAGFIMAATHHLGNKNTEQAKIYSLKGIEYACGRLPIVYKAIQIMVEAAGKKEAEKIYLSLTLPTQNINDRVMDLKIRELIQPKEKTLMECNKFIADKVEHPDIYQIMINCLKTIGKDPHDIIYQARKKFPDLQF